MRNPLLVAKLRGVPGVWPLLIVQLATAAAAQESAMSPPTHLVPADKGLTPQLLNVLHDRGQQRTYTGQARTTIGMPCGGIAAGQLYVRGDGTLGCWQIDGGNNFGGVGHESYATYRPAQPIEQGFALAVTAAGRRTAATLDDAGYDAIEFVGEYPRALIRYRAKDKTVPPVEVDLEVFSPFIPLNAKESAWPATVLRFTVQNPTDQPLDVVLGGWLQNMTFAEHPSALTIRRRAESRSAAGVTTVLLDAVEDRPTPPAGPPQTRVLADFESGTYDGWTVTGDAFGTAPATGTLPNQSPVTGFGGQYLVNSFNRGDDTTGKMTSTPFTVDLPYLSFRIGGGNYPSETCLNLIVDDRVVHTATGRNSEQLAPEIWDVSDYVGRQAHLEIVDRRKGPWGHVLVDDIALTNVLPADLREYDEKSLGFGNLALSLIGQGIADTVWAGKDGFLQTLGQTRPQPGATSKPAGDAPVIGTLTTKFTLPAGESRDVTFIVSWYFPNLHTGHGRMYTNWFTDSADVARRLAANLDRLHGDTVRFCDAYYRGTTLPWWLTSRLMMPVSTLATGTVQWWKSGRFWAWEGVCCCEGTCTHVWNYAQAYAWLFPELARSARVMQDLGEAFDEKTGLVGFRGNRSFAADGQAGTILKCYREHLVGPDDAFLKQHWPRIKAALEYLIVKEDGNDDGIIESDRQHNTYDINFVGPNTFVGSLYLAALRAGEEMARLTGDTAAAERYHAIFERGSQWTAANLFNGEYFEQRVPPGPRAGVTPAPPPDWQYGSGCLSDQLFGQTWVHVLNLGYIYPPDNVRSALRAVFKYNWAPDVGALSKNWPPDRWFARPGEPGLFVCTWPRGGRAKQPVMYRDEVWTGIEYQVAAGLAWEGMTDEALLIVHGIDERYDGAKHNPWNEVECGDHYARALASWGVLHALAGFTYDGPAGRLALAPRIQPDDFACFFCVGSGWGNLRQKRTAGTQTSATDLRSAVKTNATALRAATQTNTIDLRAGTLKLTQLRVSVPPGTVVKQAEVLLADAADPTAQARKVPAQWVPAESEGEVRFEPAFRLRADQQLLVVLTW